MWIARDERGELNMFTDKPNRIELNSPPWIDSNGNQRNSEFIYDGNKKCRRYSLSRDRYPNITFENSPKELILRELAEEYGERCYNRGYSDCDRFAYGETEYGNITFDEYVDSKK